jgi:FkbM family methyltransferase
MGTRNRTINRVSRALSKRLGILRVGRRRTRDLFDFLETRAIDLVVDVGANVGQFGDSLRAGGYRGRIVSFEPVQAAFAALSRKADADGNWEADLCALGAAPGEADIHVSALSVFSSILDLTPNANLHDQRIAVDHAERVPVRTLDEIAATLTGNLLLKIDTQGYERQVLEGGRQTLNRALGVLMELPVIHVYRGEWKMQQAIEYMEQAGFVLAQVQAVGYHGRDPAAAVDFDCLFRRRAVIDETETALPQSQPPP